ncbi:MAG: hypothetical protein ucyna2_00063 [Candidatus Atelocyanobacterium thalassa isolate SIO64986]|uniref:Uncharacterized protein n=1 Tax=Candidatus Atelocyanobacterium thalassa isolate SIO64986 TaxID=1527444 RepID=A0A086CIJ1_9CHRO|nr:MAG: hypothetical protein ucyna2_00063 [Candidatus Atelocyanobacterium thalassa isolate SIO64986]
MAYLFNTSANYFSIAPAHIFKGENIISLGSRPLIIVRDTTLPIIGNHLKAILKEY